MDENSGSRRERATASATALGAAALLVLSFGPSALALSPSAPASPSTVQHAERPWNTGGSTMPAPRSATQEGRERQIET